MHSTAHDAALMMQEAMKSDTFREIVASDDSWIEVTGADGSDHSHSMDTHNELLGQDGNIGGKTALPTMPATALRQPTTAMATRPIPSF